MASPDTHKTIETVFRIEQARLIAGLARMLRDVGRAEDPAQEALLSFLFLLDSPSAFGSRIGFLAGPLFATVINRRVASTELGSDDG